MKFRLLKASEDWEVLRRHHDTENGEDYYYIWGPDGEYCDADGNPYHFDTREDALEEVEYLKAEHKFDKKSKKVKSGESYGWVVNPEDAFDKLSLWVETVGAEAALDDLARAMGPDELSDNLAFIFRNNDFKEGCSDYEEDEDERWEVDGFTYDTEEDARLEFKNVCESEPSEDHVLMLNDEEVEFYKGK